MTDRSLLDHISIATPCSADWNAMSGDDRTRFCQQCSLHVHDLSAMTADEGLALLRSSNGRICARFYRRADGKVLTKDCPVGLKQRVRWAWARAVAMITALSTLGACRGERAPAPVVPGVPAGTQPLQGDVLVPADRRPVMGEVAAPLAQPVPQAPQDGAHPLMGKIQIREEIECERPIGASVKPPNDRIDELPVAPPEPAPAAAPVVKDPK